MNELVIKVNSLPLSQRYQRGISLQHFIVLRERLGNVWATLSSKHIMAPRNDEQASILPFRINQWTPQIEGSVLRFVYEIEILVRFYLPVLGKLYHQVRIEDFIAEHEVFNDAAYVRRY